MKKALTIEEIDLLEQRFIERARESFWVYRQYINKNLLIGWFVKELCRELQEWFGLYKAGKNPKLIIQIAPQHGKSTAVIDFLSWVAGQDPDSRVIYATFSDRLGIRANLKLQKIYDSEKFKKVFPETKINTLNAVTVSGQTLRNREIIEYVGRDGYFHNVTVNGAVTGMSANILAWDDMIKGHAEANSETLRNRTHEWLESDFMTRASNDYAVLGVGTEWHIDSPVQRYIKSNPDCKIIKYKAIAEEEEKYRKAGEALFPELKSLQFLEERKRSMNPLAWLALYQSSPTLASGNLFSRETFRYYTYDNGYVTIDGKSLLLSNYKIYQIIDPAGTEKKNSDYFVIMTIGVSIHNSDIIVLDIRREKAETPKHLDMLNQEYERWKPINQYVENKSFGINIIQAFSKTNRPVKTLEAKGDKPTRAQITQGFYDNGKIYHRQGAHWLSEFEQELLQFPYGTHDDMVDCIAYAGIVVQSMPLTTNRVVSTRRL